jgi:ribonuclease III
MNPIENLIKNADKIESKLGYHFRDRSLLALAFVHRSFVNENRGMTLHNERLEFLGDSILGMLVSDYLYNNLPDTPEGDLSYLRSRLVQAQSCVNYIQSLDIASFILLGKGERLNDGRGRETILSDLFEAIVGAIYLDGGIEAVKKFIFDKFKSHIATILHMPLRNWKAQLQDFCQKKFQRTPYYVVLEESGPDHGKMFIMSVKINHDELGQGRGASKKEAQQAAAEDALTKLEKK